MTQPTCRTCRHTRCAQAPECLNKPCGTCAEEGYRLWQPINRAERKLYLKELEREEARLQKAWIAEHPEFKKPRAVSRSAKICEVKQ